MKALSKYLKKVRLNQNLSQAAVAAELGYTSPQFVSNWERGISSPPLEALPTLMKILKINPDELIKLMLKEKRKELEKALG